MTKIAWLALAGVHVAPAAVLVRPSLTMRLYGVAPADDVGVLVVHRGALFLGIVVLAAWAAFDPAARRAASVATAIGVVGFLLVYARAGLPAGALRTIAVADLVALAPLGIVLRDAWWP